MTYCNSVIFNVLTFNTILPLDLNRTKVFIKNVIFCCYFEYYNMYTVQMIKRIMYTNFTTHTQRFIKTYYYHLWFNLKMLILEKNIADIVNKFSVEPCAAFKTVLNDNTTVKHLEQIQHKVSHDH